MADGNMVNLSPTIPINVSRDPGKVENVYIGASCSPNEIKELLQLQRFPKFLKNLDPPFNFILPGFAFDR